MKGPQIDVSKKLQEETREVTEIFASMMNQTVDAANQMVDDTSSEIGISKADGTQAVTDSYERYSYKDNQIEATKGHEVTAEEMDAVEENLEQAEEEILNTLSEEYGVDEDTIRNLLDDMGLNVLDLLDPKNLVSFIMALTGVSSGEELLLDENFLKVMETMDALSQELMKELNVDMKGLQDMISQMETVKLENGQVAFEQELDAQLENLDTQNLQTADENLAEVENANAETVATNAVEEVTEQDAQNATEVSENVSAEMTDEISEGIKVQVEEQEKTTETKVEKTQVEEVGTSTETDAEASLFDNQEAGSDFLWDQNTGSNQVFVTSQSSVIGQASEMPQMNISSYLSVDTAQIMEQIAEQIKVVVTPDTTSMEMQLNPENLGRIYLNVSAEEGVVNAQFIATNEVVKEALEAQIATLRENLNQAGVKVDAIEVTIASHEFERNLEQNQKSPEEQVQDEKTSRRRNLTADSLDELQGVMTEEETLVAQIMRDNGNSVDFTA